MLAKEEFKRYQKQIMVDDIGFSGQIKLKQSKVAVVGAGGLGCPVLQYLTSTGVGTIGVIDFDVVEESNLHRQILYTMNDLGFPKVERAIQRLSEQNPYVSFVSHQVLLGENNVEEILADYDVVVDGCDNFLTRYLVNDTCVKLGKPLVYGSILNYQGQLSVFNYKGSKNLRDLFPEPPNPEEVPPCSENGVLGTVAAVIGSLMAQETIDLILDVPSVVNSLLIYDCKQMKQTRLFY